MNQNEFIYAIMEWVANGETGASSCTIAYTVLDVPFDRTRHPLDPADLRRCVELLDQIPEIRKHMDKLRDVSPIWNDLIDNWNDLETMLKIEMKTGNNAPGTYELMKKIIGERR